MKRPRIYGNEGRCKALIARYIAGADDLLDQAEGVRNRVTATGDRDSIAAFSMELEWGKDFRQWFGRTWRGMSRYLQDEMPGALPVLAAGLPPDSGKPRHTITLDNGVPWLREARDELDALRTALGVRRGVTARASAPARFEELHASGLVDADVIADYAKDMLAPRTPKQLHRAIGAAKELTEATLRGALDRLGEPYARGEELPALMRKWRKALGRVAPPDHEGEDALDKAQAALANLVTFLAEWRNAYGSGHGRKQYPPNLSARHARLAADAAETCVRFIAATMDDLQLLSPEQ
jgi:hypothetical protein